MKRLVIDLDGTICDMPPQRNDAEDPIKRYSHAVPQFEVISRLKEYKSAGFTIVISTSRNMRTLDGDLTLIKAKTLPIIVAWLDAHQVPYDEIVVGKPWCGTDGFYVDDRAIRPTEFVSMNYADIMGLISGG